MATSTIKALIIDDDKAMRDACHQILSRLGYEVEVASNGHLGLALLEKASFDLVLLDLVMPDQNGVEVLKQIKVLDPQVQVVIITGYGTIASAVETIKLGAFDFLPKPFTPDDLRQVVKRALVKQREGETPVVRKDESDGLRIVHESEAMARVMEMAQRVALSDSTVLITGESGTGKGLIAQKIHALSDRRQQPFITVDCGALVETLFESELFGHVKGAFTGANSNKIGKFELAQGGTLFFDEVSNISLEVQAKLLRAVQELKISRVGSHRVISVDVRIIAATNRDLSQAIRTGIFREDLFYRLNVVSIHIPPLRRRKSDITPLIGYFLDKYNRRLKKSVQGFTPEALELMLEYNWPGNVRELENTIERLVVFSVGPYLELADLAFSGVEFGPQPGSEAISLKDMERDHILRILQQCEGRRSDTARLLGIDRKTLREKLKRYQIE
ncbi:sigma-54-dependent transcriptional regulator [Desulfobacca acetoxidans]|uniref:Two component, sigma54 specific, transcriptional regulator, Fis family n=1 Tax=Desulfobacca acetoxidans (strain ATCC 700848 / DSM 11109 / ASRB2) TaxID=880072 RepID=F2NCE7_DESAR|nr:sigma-54 dependent transcriptional regulator [Desulfobacca acetoxidans]AEB09011.1 two component, sigma54 specific, transcriptional regulator, Fis family [Desulfobacca acetoxidans DSM 11109]HAY22075.1 sigma-54-dependent Fis family transcriptional regulator [Desulfobacterales bacterium]